MFYKTTHVPVPVPVQCAQCPHVLVHWTNTNILSIGCAAVCKQFLAEIATQIYLLGTLYKSPCAVQLRTSTHSHTLTHKHVRTRFTSIAQNEIACVIVYLRQDVIVDLVFLFVY